MSSPGIITLESNGGLKFGDYASKKKLKSDDFEVNGDVYKVKSHCEITRAEKNGKLLFESVPGSLVKNFSLNENRCSFSIEGFENTQITVGLEQETEYKIFIDEISVGKSKSNLSSKLMFSVELHDNAKDVRIERA